MEYRSWGPARVVSRSRREVLEHFGGGLGSLHRSGYDLTPRAHPVLATHGPATATVPLQDGCLRGRRARGTSGTRQSLHRTGAGGGCRRSHVAWRFAGWTSFDDRRSPERRGSSVLALLDVKVIHIAERKIDQAPGGSSTPGASTALIRRYLNLLHF